MNSRSRWVEAVQTTEDETARLLEGKWRASQVRLGLGGAGRRGGRLDVAEVPDMVESMAFIEGLLNDYHAILKCERGRLREDGGR